VRDDAVVQGALQRRLETVDREIADLQSLLVVMGRIERDERLKELLRTADLGFRLQDLWAGRITGERLRRALETPAALTAPAAVDRARARARASGLAPAR
jgi:hypothetical protein